MIEEKLRAARRQVREGILDILQVECYRYETAWERLEHFESRLRRLRIPFEYYRSHYPRAELGTADALFQAARRCGLVGHPDLSPQDVHAALIPAILKNTNAAVLKRFQRRLNAVPRPRTAAARAADRSQHGVRVHETWFRFLLGVLEGIGADLRKRPQIARNFIALHSAFRQQPVHVQGYYVLRFYGGVLSGLYEAAEDFLGALYDLLRAARSLDQTGQDAIVAFLSEEQTRAEVFEFLWSLKELPGPLLQFLGELEEAAYQEARGIGNALGAALSASVAGPLDTEDLEDFTWELGKLLATLLFDLVLAVALQAAGPIIVRGKTLVRFLGKAATDRFVAIVEAALRRHPDIVRAIEKLDALLLRIADRPWKRPRSRQGGIGAQSQPSGGGSGGGSPESGVQPGASSGKGKPSNPRLLSGPALQRKFRAWTLKKILAREKPPHPLHFLVDEKTMTWKRPKTRAHADLIEAPEVWEAAHVESAKLAKITRNPERVSVTTAYHNQYDRVAAERPRTPGMAVRDRPLIEIGGIPVDPRSAKLWVDRGLLDEKWVRNAEPHPGWNTDHL